MKRCIRARCAAMLLACWAVATTAAAQAAASVGLLIDSVRLDRTATAERIIQFLEQHDQAKGGNYVCSGTEEDRECIKGELCPYTSLTGGEESRAVTLNHGSTSPFVDLSGKVFWSHSSDPFALLRSEFG